MPWNREVDPVVSAAVAAAGGAARVARAFGISVAAVGQWRRVPDRRVRKMARLSGYDVHQLRADLFDATGNRVKNGGRGAA